MPKKPAPYIEISKEDTDRLRELMFYNSDNDLTYMKYGSDDRYTGVPKDMTKANSQKYMELIIDSGIPLTPQFMLKAFKFRELDQTFQKKAMQRTFSGEYGGVRLDNPSYITRLNALNVKYLGNPTDEVYTSRIKEAEEKVFTMRKNRGIEVNKPPSAPSTPVKEKQELATESEEEEDEKPVNPKELIKAVAQTDRKKPEDYRSYLNLIRSSEEAEVTIAQLTLKAQEIMSQSPDSSEQQIVNDIQINEIEDRIREISEKRDILMMEEEAKQLLEAEKLAKIAINEATNTVTIKALGVMRDKSLTREETEKKLADLGYDVTLVENYDDLMNDLKPVGYKPPEPEAVEQGDPLQVPETQEQIETAPTQFGVAVKQVEKVFFHKDAVFLMYNNDLSPDWDLELEESIMGREFSSDFLKTSCQDIINDYGSKIHVKELKDDGSKQEFLELTQLQYSLERGMGKGSRTKHASMSIKDLTNFSNSLTQTSTTSTTTSNPDDITPLDQVETTLQQTPNAPTRLETPVVQIPMNIARQNVTDALNKSLKKYSINGTPLNISKYKPIQPIIKPSFDNRDYLNLFPSEVPNKYRFL